MVYIVKSAVEEFTAREADRLVASLKSARRELRSERRKVCRPHL